MTPIDDCLNRGAPPLPWVWGLAARINGQNPETMLADPGVLARSLGIAADLFDLPAVCTSFDTTLEAEAAGCPVQADGGRTGRVGGLVETVDDAIEFEITGVTERGRIPVVLDAADRLVATHPGTSVLGGLTGPGRLTRSLLVDGEADDSVVEETAFAASDVAISMANGYLDQGADGIAVLEPEGVAPADWYLDAITPLINVIEHYGATGVLVQRTVGIDDVALAADLGFHAITGRVDDPVAAIDAANEADIVLGVGVPSERFNGGPEAVDELLAELPGKALLSSEWEVPAETEAETVLRLMGSL